MDKENIFTEPSRKNERVPNFLINEMESITASKKNIARNIAIEYVIAKDLKEDDLWDYEEYLGYLVYAITLTRSHSLSLMRKFGDKEAEKIYRWADKEVNKWEKKRESIQKKLKY